MAIEAEGGRNTQTIFLSSTAKRMKDEDGPAHAERESSCEVSIISGLDFWLTCLTDGQSSRSCTKTDHPLILEHQKLT